MTHQRLIIYIDEIWPEQPPAPWVLLDERDRITEEGHSDPRHWPAAESCEIVLGATQASWLEARLPRTSQRHQDRLLRYALENQLVRDVEDQHLTITRRRSDEEGEGMLANVLVVGRARLRQLLAQFNAIGRKPARIISELQSVPHHDESWTFACGPTEKLIVRYGEHNAVSTEALFAPDILVHLLQQARANNHAPAALDILPATNNHTLPPGINLEDLQKATGLPCRSGHRYAWWQHARTANNLLHDEFAPSGTNGQFARLRAPLWLTAAACTVWLAITLGEVIWQRSQLATIETRMQRLFETAVPNTPAISPMLQLGRALDEQKSLHGQLRRDDLLSLLTAYGEIRGTSARNSITAMEYDGGMLRLTLSATDSEESALLKARFAELGYTFNASEDNARQIVLAPRSQP